MIIEALKAWVNFRQPNAPAVFKSLWLGPDCALLKDARACHCQFDGRVARWLNKASEHDHLESARFFYGHTETPPAQAVRQMEFLLSVVQAARDWSRWRIRREERYLEAFERAATAALQACQDVWPLGGTVIPEMPKTDSFLVPHYDRPLVQSLLQVAQQVRVQTSAFLAVKHVLEFLVPDQQTPQGNGVPDLDFTTNTRMLLCFEGETAQGRQETIRGVGDLKIATTKEIDFAVYLDPLALGMTVVDDTTLESLRAAWSKCEPGLRGRVDPDEHASLAVCLSPYTATIESLTGQSAGLLFACGIRAAALRKDLDSDATATVKLDPANPSVLRPVDDDTLPEKLRAAKDAGIRRVLLEAKQAGRFRALATSLGLEAIGVSSLAEAWEQLTARAAAARKMEEVLKAYAADKLAKWEEARANQNDPDGLTHYVEPHYAVLPEDRDPFDVAQRMAHRRRGDDDVEPRELYERIEGEGDEALARLLQLGHRLCVTEDAGMGKSIFARRAQAFLSSPAGWNSLDAPGPFLALRWESDWPDDVPKRMEEEIESACRRAAPVVKPRDVVRWAMRNNRVILILDALDQVPESETQKLVRLANFLDSEDGSHCRVILTSRPFEVPEQGHTLFRGRKWRFAQMEGFDEEQQEEYLEGLFDESLDELIPNREEVGDLLRFPVVLFMIRKLAEAGELRPFRNRADLYLAAGSFMLERAAPKSGLHVDGRFSHDDIPRLEEILAATAFEMMLHQRYDYVEHGKNRVRTLKKHAAVRCEKPVDREEWQMVKAATDLTNRCILEGVTDEFLGWKHRGMMEYYCGVYLASYAPAECLEDVRPFANNTQWSWAWRFAIELGDVHAARGDDDDDVVTPEVLCRSLAPLYERPEQGTRPTELMYRAWEVLEKVLGGQAVLDRFRAEFRFRKRPKKKGSENTKDEVMPNFIRCPAGEFWMGATDNDKEAGDDERPRHRVSVSEFLLQSTTVTKAQYQLFDPHHESRWGDDRPVTEVTWYDAWVFARWIGGRLPTEAQWEYACRAGTETIYSIGDDPERLGDYAWYTENSDREAHPVATKEPNRWGLYDMLGNVDEWCFDWYDEKFYATSPPSDPAGPEAASTRVIRGGCWRYVAGRRRAADRDWVVPGGRDDDLGFRVAAVPPGGPSQEPGNKQAEPGA